MNRTVQNQTEAESKKHFDLGVETFLQRIGRATDEFFRSLGELTTLFYQTILYCFKPPFRLRMIVDQMVSIGVMSIPIALLTASFTGMVLVLQTGVQLKPLGMKIYSSGISAIGFTREIGPVLTAVVLAGRVAAGIAAEVGTMKVTEQIDAMKTMGTSPVSYLVVPRFIASTFMFPALTVLSIAVGLFGGFIVGVFVLNITPGLYITNIWNWLEPKDYYTGLFKTFFFGMIVAIIGCYKGFHTGFGAQGVGDATKEAVVYSSILILIANFMLTTWIIHLFP